MCRADAPNRMRRPFPGRQKQERRNDSVSPVLCFPRFYLFSKLFVPIRADYRRDLRTILIYHRIQPLRRIQNAIRKGPCSVIFP